MQKDKTMNASQSPVSFSQILLHRAPHLDEIAAVWLLKKYGEACFPGIGGAEVRFTDNLASQNDVYFDSQRILPVGCGEARFDEHRSITQGIERLQDECATTLVAKHLGIVDRATLQIVAEALRCDSKPGVKTTELAEIIKAVTRHCPNDAGTRVVRWTTVVLDAIEKQLRLGYSRVVGEESVLQCFNRLRTSNHFPEVRAAESVAKMLGQSEARTSTITELSSIATALQRTTSDDAGEYIRFALDALYADQVEFWQAVEECKAKGKWYDTLTLSGRKDVRVPMCIIVTDNPLAARAAKLKEAGGAAIVVIQNDKDQVQIFLNRNAAPWVNLDNCARMLRWTKMAASRDNPCNAVPWDQLAHEGTMEFAALELYYSPKAGQILNGSLSHPDVPALGIHINALTDLLRRAFHPRLTADWMRERGIQRSNSLHNHLRFPDEEMNGEQSHANRATQ